tara:strand:+ start:1039 stop:1314 length:276 start_codon:yes stop_codon:yes gene_type:complete
MKKKLCILDENAHWWKNDPEIKQWAIEDKDGTWWLVGGSEFPEKKVDKNMKVKHKRMGQRSLPMRVDYMLLFLLAALLGISLALNVIHYML